VIGKDYAMPKKTIQQYLNMIEEKPYDASVLDEAIVFMNTGKQAARIHCATMGWTAMKELLEKERNNMADTKFLDQEYNTVSRPMPRFFSRRAKASMPMWSARFPSISMSRNGCRIPP
jgi:hypothetical protein